MGFKVYDYRCSKCDLVFEVTVDTDNKEIIKCPKCKGKKVEKQLMFGGYSIKGNNSASVRPKNSGSFKRRA